MSQVEETKQCPNCELDILFSNYTVHTVYCQRNIFICSKCQQPVNYNHKLEHESESHVNVYCTDCHIQLEKWCLKEHLINHCPYRNIKCQFCDIEVKATDITEHENYCGSRTEKCIECGEFVMLKYKVLHVDSNHTFIKLSDEPGPSPSWQYGKRTLSNFMPDMTSKDFKRLPAHKLRSLEMRRSRNYAESNEGNNLSDSGARHKSSTKQNRSNNDSDDDNDNDDIVKEYDVVKVKEVEKLAKKDEDEWPTLSSLRSLQISEDCLKDWRKSKATSSEPSVANKYSDLMYASKVSQKFDSHIWEKELATGEDETLKNSLHSLTETHKLQEKNTDKNLILLRKKKKSVDDGVKSKGDSDQDLLSSGHNEEEAQEPVKIPCEFCGSSVLFHYIYLHELRCRRENSDWRPSRPKFSSITEDIENKIYCQKNQSKSWKSLDKVNFQRKIKPNSIKSEPGLQNGVEQSCPRLTRGGTRSEWLSDLSKSSTEGGNELKKNLNHPETGVVRKVSKSSRKNRRAPSPPKM